MMFTNEQQAEHRNAFIAECRQKAWGALCHAAYIEKNLDDLLARYQKLQAEDATYAADIKELERALDSHTVDNRNKRKDLQEKRNALAPQMQAIGQSAQDGQKAMQQLLHSVETNLDLATHAETWEWKEQSKP